MNTSAFIQFVFSFFLLASLLSACHQIDEEDLTGYWTFEYGIPSPEGSIYAFRFRENRVEFEGKHGFWYEGTYQIKNQAIQIKTNNGYKLNWPITHLEQDTLQLRDSATYIRFADQHKDQLEIYSLMNLPTIDTLGSKKMVGIIHFFKNADGQPRLGLADKITDIENLVLYLKGPRYRQDPLEILLFLDKSILLSDLWEVHINLAQQRHNKINVVMNHDFPQPLPIFKYKTYFWGEDLENYRKYQKIKVALPPPPPGPYSKAEFLQDGGLTIAINNQQDGEKFSTMRDGEKYLVSFSSQMSLTEYFKIKMALYKIAKEKKIYLRTEIRLIE